MSEEQQPLAYRIRDYVREHAEDENADLSIPAIAKALNEEVVVVGFVLDSFFVDPDDGKVRYVGTGGGGGWVPIKELAPEQVLQRQLDDNVITQEDYDLRMELIKRGEDPRDAAAMQKLLEERDG